MDGVLPSRDFWELVRDCIERHLADHPGPTVLVTHDQAEALSFADARFDEVSVLEERVAALFALPLLMLASPLVAQEGGRTCQYDLECGGANYCNDRGRCVPRGTIGQPTDESAGDECGADRRCRIDRLERRNKAARHAKIIEEEKYVQTILANEEEERLKKFPRLADPLSGDIRISRLGPLGLHAGYTFFGHLQAELDVAYSDLYVYVPADGGGGEVSGYHQGTFLRGGASYFLLESWFSPYLSAGFQFGTGRFRNDSFFFGGNGTTTEFHAADFGGGVDVQFGFGLHTRLGLAYRPLIYNQARIGPGQYDVVAQQGLARWYDEAVRIDVVWLLGWAI